MAVRELRLRNRAVVYAIPAKTMKQRNQEILDKLKQHHILPSDTQNITVRELRGVAKQRGLHGYSWRGKADLADFIVLNSVEPFLARSLQGLTVKKLRVVAKLHGLRGYSRKRKTDLVDCIYSYGAALNVEDFDRFLLKSDIYMLDNFPTADFLSRRSAIVQLRNDYYKLYNAPAA